MANISGYWEFHRACPAEEMGIFGVDNTGALLNSSINNAPINGNYNATTNAISFNDARQPGATLFVSFYTGYVMPDGQGGACAMAGTFQELELIFEQALSAAPTPSPGPSPIPHPTVYNTVYGAWYAIYQGPIIQ